MNLEYDKDQKRGYNIHMGMSLFVMIFMIIQVLSLLFFIVLETNISISFLDCFLGSIVLIIAIILQPQ